jgi:hypothetical protein
VVMTVLLTGWSGQAVASPAGAAAGGAIGAVSPARHSGEEIGYRLSREDRGGILLSVASGDLVTRKTVQADGRSDVVITRNNDAVSIVATRLTIVVTRGTQSLTVNVNGGHDKQLARVRALLLGSAATRALRTLATLLEESGTDAPERMGLRLTGALIGQLDGDEGAVRRLSRELQARYGPRTRRTRNARVDGWAIFQAGVTKACADLETCLESCCSVHSMRQVSSFVWLYHVERLWFAYLACSSARLHDARPSGAR